MAEDDAYVDLEPGDFVYQSDQELFLVVMEETEDGYRFAVHGWREIGHNRLHEYIEGEHGKLYKEDELEQIIEEEADDDTRQHFERLRDVFEQYREGETEDEGPHTDFVMEDT